MKVTNEARDMIEAAFGVTLPLEVPQAGEVWQHHNGQAYIVACITNLCNLSAAYPPDVVYMTAEKHGDKYFSNVNKVWSRQLIDWHSSFTKLEDAR